MATTASARPHRAQLVDQVVERVAMLAEDDHLAALAVGVEHLGTLLHEA